MKNMNPEEKEGMRRAFAALTAWMSTTSPDALGDTSSKQLMNFIETIGLDIKDSPEGYGEAFVNYSLSLVMLLDAALILGGVTSEAEKLEFIQKASILNEIVDTNHFLY